MPVRTKKRHKYPLKNPKPQITPTCNAAPRGCRLPSPAHQALHPDADVQVPGTAQQKARSALLPHARRTSPERHPGTALTHAAPRPGQTRQRADGPRANKTTPDRHRPTHLPSARRKETCSAYIPPDFSAFGHGRSETDGVCRPHAVGLSVPHVDGILAPSKPNTLQPAFLQGRIGHRHGIVPTHSDPLART